MLTIGFMKLCSNQLKLTSGVSVPLALSDDRKLSLSSECELNRGRGEVLS